MSYKTWIGLIIIISLSILMTFFAPVNDIFKGIVSLPAIGGLSLALFQLFRDENNHLHNKEIQKEQQLFNLGATSHMANTVFDKHVEFCEKYLEEVHNLLKTLYRDGPTENALNHSSVLYSLRMEYTAWITIDIDKKLIPFENAIKEIGSKSHLIEALRNKEESNKERLKAIDELYNVFNEMMNLSYETAPKDAESFIVIKERVRDILQVRKLTEIREFLVNKAYEIGKEK
jgi:hypothetical protein